MIIYINGYLLMCAKNWEKVMELQMTCLNKPKLEFLKVKNLSLKNIMYVHSYGVHTGCQKFSTYY